MKHLNTVTRAADHPEKAASILVNQQKVALFAAFATALGAFGNSVGVIRDLFGGEE